MSSLGFTGTQAGLTARQSDALALFLIGARNRGVKVMLHGCCIGADEEAVAVARTARIPAIVGLPASPLGAPKRSRVRNDFTLPTQAGRNPELVRNRVIASADELVACPRQDFMLQRSGTWATVRYAREAGTPVTIIFPDGTLSERLPE